MEFKAGNRIRPNVVGKAYISGRLYYLLSEEEIEKYKEKIYVIKYAGGPTRNQVIVTDTQVGPGFTLSFWGNEVELVSECRVNRKLLL